jgi:hypothetical protein
MNHDKRKERIRRGPYWARRMPGHPLASRDGYVLEHRLVLHAAGVEIPPGHHVHHVNGVKDDNRIENLVALPASDHHRHHVGDAVVNQSGTHPVLRDPVAWKARKDELNRANAQRWRLKYPERARAADAARKQRRKEGR